MASRHYFLKRLIKKKNNLHFLENMPLLLSSITLTLPGQEDKNENRSSVTPCNIIFSRGELTLFLKKNTLCSC